MTTAARRACLAAQIANWHSILRNGLNYSKTSHGRSYGDGIYLALDAATSLGYTHSTRAGGHNQATDRVGTSEFSHPVRADRHQPNCFDGASWVGGKSLFDESLACLAIVDVIYRPEQFVSTTPHWVIKVRCGTLSV